MRQSIARIQPNKFRHKAKPLDLMVEPRNILQSITRRAGRDVAIGDQVMLGIDGAMLGIAKAKFDFVAHDEAAVGVGG